jgi:hypothetical protein
MSVFEPLGDTIKRDGLESNEDVVKTRMLAVIVGGDGTTTPLSMVTGGGDALALS